MSIPRRFLVQQFQLEVNDAAYLVEVSVHNGNAEGVEELNKLPGWVFQSKHAIWLSRKSGTLIDRAMEGERIRKELKSASNTL